MSKYQQNDEPGKKITEYERSILYAFYGPVPATSNDEAVLFKVKNAVEAAEPELNRLRAENEKLRSALKPFADIASKLRGDATDWSFFANGSDIRAAAAALKETGDE